MFLEVLMKKFSWTIFAVLILLPLCANATTIDFNENGTITDGNYFDRVNVWDSATVDMTGGQVLDFYAYQTSTVNLSGGTISWFYTSGSSALLNMSGGVIDRSLNVGGSSVTNLTGGQIPFYSTGAYISAGDSATVNIYGYGFSLDGHYLSGYWADGTAFYIWLRGSETPSHVVLIPEPVSILLFGLASLALRRS